jgi:hypothetical protein
MKCTFGRVRAFQLASAAIWIAVQFLYAATAAAQARIPLQPLTQQVRQVESAVAYLGQPFTRGDQDAINQAVADADEEAAVARLQQVLDKYALAVVEINPESRVKVQPGLAKAELVEAGARVFLVKVINKAGVTARLEVQSPNALPIYAQSDESAEPPKTISPADIRDRWMDIELYDKNPMSERLSGQALEYRILEIYSRDTGALSAKLSFSVGQGTQDIGFRSEMVVPFNALPAYRLRLRVLDEKGLPSIAAFTIRDNLGRLYPNPSKRLAPDLFFQPQVYRANGETVLLPEGSYTIVCAMGPEYHAQAKRVEVTPTGTNEVLFAMQRWIDPAKYGWFSGDHHVHAAGCSHYQNPSEGVRPEDMIRQILGEKLNVGAVLTWGPCYYYQKQFFTGKDDPLSKPDELMHYDLEVSGFPSSHAGHLVLLGLTDQDYPHCVRIEQWPTWDLPVLRWAKSQAALAGFAHSGWGLLVKSTEIPNYEIPGFDSIGANEYIVDVTFPGAVDFISAGDTPYTSELNIWYHTLNVGFRTRISGETDFPCITDSRVGQGRVYAKVEGPLTYSAWLDALRSGRSYVSDGRSHLIDFSVNGQEIGMNGSEVKLDTSGTVHAAVKVSAYLPSDLAAPNNDAADREPHWMATYSDADLKRILAEPYADAAEGRKIHDRPVDQEPYWHLERARIGNTREVAVELVMNGKSVARKNIVADGTMHDVTFDVPVERSSWLAVRILGSSHTNPIFVLVGGKPIRASRKSAEWCLAGVNQCWTQKAPQISKTELPEAQAAYQHAREAYTKLIDECTASEQTKPD